MKRQTSYQQSAISRQLSAFSHQLLAFSLFAIQLTSTPAAAEERKVKDTPENIYIVNEYRYVPATAADDKDIGHALCGTRCNALSSSYKNILEPGGWSLVRISSNKEITLELKSPFLGGQCVCVADEYSVKITDPGGPRNQRPFAQRKTRDR